MSRTLWLTAEVTAETEPEGSTAGPPPTLEDEPERSSCSVSFLAWADTELRGLVAEDELGSRPPAEPHDESMPVMPICPSNGSEHLRLPRGNPVDVIGGHCPWLKAGPGGCHQTRIHGTLPCRPGPLGDARVGGQR
jgi:hypothetical protein